MKRTSSKKSIVWEFFIKAADNATVRCSLCQKILKFFNNTSNLKDHLTRTHPIQLKAAKEGIEPIVEITEFSVEGTPEKTTNNALNSDSNCDSSSAKRPRQIKVYSTNQKEVISEVDQTGLLEWMITPDAPMTIVSAEPSTSANGKKNPEVMVLSANPETQGTTEDVEMATEEISVVYSDSLSHSPSLTKKFCPKSVTVPSDGYILVNTNSNDPKHSSPVIILPEVKPKKKDASQQTRLTMSMMKTQSDVLRGRRLFNPPYTKDYARMKQEKIEAIRENTSALFDIAASQRELCATQSEVATAQRELAAAQQSISCSLDSLTQAALQITDQLLKKLNKQK